VLPVVAAKITEARLSHYNNGGGTVYEAIIVFQYKFRGVEYESKTPALRGAQIFPLYNFESELIDKYKEGEIYNAKVFPDMPELAYLQIAPLSKVSVFLLPIAMVSLFAYIFGVGWWFSYFL
jgi:hypothetical protein